MKKQQRLYEPITGKQINMIWRMAEVHHVSEASVYKLVKKLIGVDIITALSKQEASFIIDRLKGQSQWVKPRPPRKAEWIPGATSALPCHGHIIGIRNAFKEMGWSKTQISTWLRKYPKVSAIRELNRRQAQGAYIRLTETMKRGGLVTNLLRQMKV